MAMSIDSVQHGASPLIVIVGPTAVGKTRLAVRLCEELGGEIVSADSRQIYRYMDIGTAKPSEDERRRVPHHLIDIVDPNERFTLAQYQDLAYRAIDGVIGRGQVPFLVGGTGLYIKAVTEGFIIPRVEPNPGLRRRLYREAAQVGRDALHAQLQGVDPIAAAKIDPRNVRRVIRALEVFEETGIPISQLQGKESPPYEMLWIGLTRPRAELYQRIDRRVDRMIERGLVGEVKDLVERGYDYDLTSMSGLGYRQIGMYLRDEVDLEKAVQFVKRDTHRFVRHQYNWFRLDDERIHWFDMTSDPYEEIKALVASFLG